MQEKIDWGTVPSRLCNEMRGKERSPTVKAGGGGWKRREVFSSVKHKHKKMSTSDFIIMDKHYITIYYIQCIQTKKTLSLKRARYDPVIEDMFVVLFCN